MLRKSESFRGQRGSDTFNNNQSKEEMETLNIHNHPTRHATQFTHWTRPQTSNSSSHSSMIISSCSQTPSTSVNARYPTPPRCIAILNRAQPPSIYLDYGIEMYRICSVSEGVKDNVYVLTIVCSSSPRTCRSSPSRHTAQLRQR